VDSINIEIRDSVQGAQSTLRKFAPAWLLADGTIRDFLDTTANNVRFYGVTSGNYYVVLRHRNHLAVMSATPMNLTATFNPLAYDFSTGQGQAFGDNPLILTGTRCSLICGNAAGSDQVINSTDRVAVRNRLGTNNYDAADVNMDGIVNSSDRVVVRNNLGKSGQVP
jgi:hypothetical protein